VALPALSTKVSDPDSTDPVNPGTYKIKSFALREVTTLGGTYNFLDKPLIFAGLDLAFVWSAIQPFVFERPAPTPSPPPFKPFWSRAWGRALASCRRASATLRRSAAAWAPRATAASGCESTLCSEPSDAQKWQAGCGRLRALWPAAKIAADGAKVPVDAVVRLPAGALFALLAGCAAGPSASRAPKNRLQQRAIHAAAVDERSFGAATYKLLLSGDATAERTGLLIGVTRHQLVRAAQRFESGNAAAGLTAVGGAFLLGRAGELRPEMLEKGEQALDAAATEVARVGNDGRALALYSMLLPRLSEGAWRSDVQSHLTAIDKFRKDTRATAPSRPRREPRAPPSAAPSSTRARRRWTPPKKPRGVAAPGAVDQHRRSADPLERRARRSLRGLPRAAGRWLHGGGALPAPARSARRPRLLDSAGLEKLMPPELRDRLERAADESDPDAWSTSITSSNRRAAAPTACSIPIWWTQRRLAPPRTVPRGAELAARYAADRDRAFDARHGRSGTAGVEPRAQRAS